jgi:hypothetical protein
VAAGEEEARRFGFQLARALQDHAREAAAQHDLDARYVIEGAAQFLTKTAERELRPPGDDAAEDARDRRN